MLPGITEANIRSAFPWVPRFRQILKESNIKPFSGTHMLIGSDYSGTHSKSGYTTYSFLVADADLSPNYPLERRILRERYLPNNRRMSFKNLNDRYRREALQPFLQTAELLMGLCVVIVVHKDLKRMTTGSNTLKIWKNLHGLQGKWTASAFEDMVRVVHFLCLLISDFSTPLQHITWITDQDEIVANDDRLTDVLNLVARMTGLYIKHPLGELAVNTTEIDTIDRIFEDFVAIPDLIAGAFSEVVNVWSSQEGWSNDKELSLHPKYLSEKSNIISTWFCQKPQNLKRIIVLIDRHEKNSFKVQQMEVFK